MKNISSYASAIMLILMAIFLITCKEDEEQPAVSANFTYELDGVDFQKVTFTNKSQNFSALSWNFGDNSTLSTETNPIHRYDELGTYTVKLTATSLDGNMTDEYSAVIAINDPNPELTKLVGDVSKTWRLLRDVSTGDYPLERGPWDHSTIWWAMGKDNDDLGLRPCILNDQWTFGRDSSLVIDLQGDYWAEDGVFEPANICSNTDEMLGPNGEDLSAWGGGNFTFELTTGASPTIKAVGLGAYLGLCKLGNGAEVSLPQDYVLYNIIKLVDGNVDTLIVEGRYQWDLNDPGGYWRFVLVHYDNPAEEPPIPTPSPVAGFDMAVIGSTINCTNTTTYGVTYLWDFGDGETSAATDVTHTYAYDGFYNITLTATNPNGSSSVTKAVFISVTSPPLTNELLQGAAWKIAVGEKTIFVGPALGSSEWWSVPKNFLTGEGTGADDWSCIVNDEFTFSAGGIYKYDSKGDVRNDGYFGSPNGCLAESALTGNGIFFASGFHSYEFNPGILISRPIITLNNGLNRAAFIGFYKGYHGGENIDGANPPNGGNLSNKYEVMGYAQGAEKEYLFISVDVSEDLSGAKAWSVILER